MPSLLAALLGASLGRDDIERDSFRAALGRIASAYDGGQIMDDESPSGDAT